MSKITIKTIQSWKNKKIFSAITAYDFTTAQIIEKSDIPIPSLLDAATPMALGTLANMFDLSSEPSPPSLCCQPEVFLRYQPTKYLYLPHEP